MPDETNDPVKRYGATEEDLPFDADTDPAPSGVDGELDVVPDQAGTQAATRRRRCRACPASPRRGTIREPGWSGLTTLDVSGIYTRAIILLGTLGR